jgi:hypothetical protein
MQIYLQLFSPMGKKKIAPGRGLFFMAGLGAYLAGVYRPSLAMIQITTASRAFS